MATISHHSHPKKNRNIVDTVIGSILSPYYIPPDNKNQLLSFDFCAKRLDKYLDKTLYKSELTVHLIEDLELFFL